MKKKKQRTQKPNKKKHKKVSTKQTNKVIESKGPKFEDLLDEMIRWFSDHQQQLDQLFSLDDADRNGSVNLQDFEQGLMKLEVPCQQLQLQTLTQLLKNANNMISYRDLNGQVRRLRLSDSSAEVNARISEEGLIKGRQAAERGDVERFIRLRVRLIPFDSSAAPPGSFEVVLSSGTKVFSLIRIIQDRVGIQTSRLEVFRRRLPTEKACLPPESSLEECGFKGGPEESPAEETVYYDYRLLFTDCPLLNCDHYLRSKPDSAARRTEYC